MKDDAWIATTVGAVANVKGGKRLPSGSKLQDNVSPHPYIRVSDMRDGGVVGSGIKYVPPEVAPAISAYRIYKDDIFISVAGTLGIVGRIPASLDGANLTENADRLTDIKCDVDYLCHYLRSTPIQNEIASIRTVGAQPKLALGRIKNFELQIPSSRREQDDIARALNSVDSLVSSIEHLIAKKRDIKQGVMQQLLTGRTRLPGYSVPWTEVTLSEVATGGRGSGLSKSSVDANGRTPCILYGELFTTYDRVIVSVVSQTDEQSSVKSIGDEVLVPGSTTTIAEDLATASALLQSGVLIGGDVNVIRPNRRRVDSSWLAYYLSSQRRNQIAEVAQGITIVHLYVRNILELLIDLPPLPEQVAIVSVLRDIESEIENLERRLESTLAIKQGMMQELLTGRTLLPAKGTE